MNEIIKNDTANQIIINIDQKIKKYLSIKDDLSEIRKNFIEDDTLEVLGDTVKIINVLSNGFKLISQKKFNKFLEGFSINQEPTEMQLRKLEKYINSPERAEFIIDSIKKTMESNSKKAIFLSGITLNKIVNSNKDLEYNDLIIFSSLSKFFDFDIENFIILDQYRKSKKMKYFDFMSIRKWAKENQIELDKSFYYTLEKCTSNQLFFKDIETDLSMDAETIDFSSAENYEEFYFTKAGEQFVENLKYIKL